MILPLLPELGLAIGLIGLAAAADAGRRARATARHCRTCPGVVAAGGPADPRALRDVGIVRYDALSERTGRLSFSVALLDSRGDGLVITAINGEAHSRFYAKSVRGGLGEQPLSPEEIQAVRAARLHRRDEPALARDGVPPARRGSGGAPVEPVPTEPAPAAANGAGTDNDHTVGAGAPAPAGAGTPS